MPIAKMHYLSKSKDGHLGSFKDLRNLCRTSSIVMYEEEEQQDTEI